MDERAFTENRRPEWDRLEAIIAKGAKSVRVLSADELKALGPLYRRAASDLSFARSHAVSPALVTYLNDLAARGYGLLYRADPRSSQGLRLFFTQDLPRTFRRRLAFFLAAAGFLFAGALVGYVVVAQNRSNIDIFIPPGSMFRKSLEAWETGKTSNAIPDSAAAETSSFLMTNNIRVSFVEFALGILGGVFTSLILFWNGAMLGALSGVMTHVHQHAHFWPGILPHGVVELSETCIAGAAGLSLGWALLAPGIYSRRDAIVLAARDSVKLVIGGIAMLIFAGLVEAFISHSLLPAPLKVLFGVVSGIALFGYLLVAGRESEPA